MPQIIPVPDMGPINSDLLDSQLKAVAPVDCLGVNTYNGAVSIVVTDTAAPVVVAALITVCRAHDANALTPTQQAAATGKLDTADLIAKADKAITDIGTKLATFQATPNLANAGPLLVELAQDVTAVIKALKFVAKQI